MRKALRLGARIALAGVTLGVALPASAEPFPAVFRLASLLPAAGGDGSAGFVLHGITEGYQAGKSVSRAGDVNGDGLDDFIIGSSNQSYVVFGSTAAFPPSFALASLLPQGGGDGSVGFVLEGDESDSLMRAVSNAGDINADGIDDLIVGVPHQVFFNYTGRCYVVFGRVGRFPARFPLGRLLPENGGDGRAGFVIEGPPSIAAYAGAAVSAAGDVNGDGIDDVIVGAPGDYPFYDEGDAYIVFGRDTAQVGDFPARFPLLDLYPDSGGDGSTGFVLAGFIPGLARTGWSVSGAADVNGDGIDDVIIGAPQMYDGSGQAYVVFGRNAAQVGNFPAMFELADLLPGRGGDGSAGFVLDGVDGSDRAGDSVSIGGDFNGDGIDDLIVGAYFVFSRGESYVVFGRDTAKVGNFPAYLSLAAVDSGHGRLGFTLPGAAPYDHAGGTVSFAGDLNDDGIDDLVIAAREAGPRSNYAGEYYVVFGRNTAQVGHFPQTLPLATLLPPVGNGRAGFAIFGIRPYDGQPNNGAGHSVNGAGDVNGDGLDDLIIGATGADPRGRSFAGESYIVYGRATTP